MSDLYTDFASSVIDVRRKSTVIIFLLPSFLILVIYSMLLSLFFPSQLFSDVLFNCSATTFIHMLFLLLQAARIQVSIPLDTSIGTMSGFWSLAFSVHSYFVAIIWFRTCGVDTSSEADSELFPKILGLFGFCRSFLFMWRQEFLLSWPLLQIPRLLAIRRAAVKSIMQSTIYSFVFVAGFFGLLLLASLVGLIEEFPASLLVPTFVTCIPLEFGWTFGTCVLNRVFTEQSSFPSTVKDGTFVHYRQYALRHQGSHGKYYMEALAVEDLANVTSGNQSKARIQIYDQQWDFVSVALSKKLKRSMKHIDNILVHRRKMGGGRNFFDEIYLLQEAWSVFRQERIIKSSLRALSHLLANSIKEDRRGTVQRDIVPLISLQLKFLGVLERYHGLVDETLLYGFHLPSSASLIYATEQALLRIMKHFAPFRGNFVLESKLDSRLNALLET